MTLLLWLSAVTRSGLKRSLKRGNFRLSGPDLCGCVNAVSCVRRRRGHTCGWNAQMPRVVLNLPEWPASRWHPYATLISALQTAAGIKIAFEDCFSCSLRSSERLSVCMVFSFVVQFDFINEKKKKELARLGDDLKCLKRRLQRQFLGIVSC